MSSEQSTLRTIRVTMQFDTTNDADRSFVEKYDGWLDGTRSEFVKMILMDSVGEQLSEKEVDEKIGAMFRRLSARGAKRRRGRIGATKKTLNPVKAVSNKASAVTSVASQTKTTEINNDSAPASLNDFSELAGGDKWQQQE